MKLEVLIPTVKKTKQDIEIFCLNLHPTTDVLIANQCENNEHYSFTINSHQIRVINSTTIGVSVNRNILLKYCNADICICIDDDCSLVTDYKKLVTDFFEGHPNCDVASFNGIYTKYNNKKVNNKKTKRVRKYNSISYAGAPGLVFKRASLQNKILFRENIGVPNEICAGEDSLFFYDLLKNKYNIFRVLDVLFMINNCELDSSYYNGIDEKYVKTRGYITYLLRKKRYLVYSVRHIIRFKKIDKTNKIINLWRWFISGVILCKKDIAVSKKKINI